MGDSRKVIDSEARAIQRQRYQEARKAAEPAPRFIKVSGFGKEARRRNTVEFLQSGATREQIESLVK